MVAENPVHLIEQQSAVIIVCLEQLIIELLTGSPPTMVILHNVIATAYQSLLATMAITHIHQSTSMAYYGSIMSLRQCHKNELEYCVDDKYIIFLLVAEHFWSSLAGISTLHMA